MKAKGEIIRNPGHDAPKEQVIENIRRRNRINSVMKQV